MVVSRLLTHLFVVGIACAALGKGAAADDRPVVVELFSSQNCGACPEANRNLMKLAEDDNIIPLTYSVDYWDYLGWKDTFAQPEFAARQKAYVERFDLRGPYTPQSVYDGSYQCSGQKKSQMASNVELGRASHSYSVRVDPQRAEDGSRILNLTGSVDGEAIVWLVTYIDGLETVEPTSGGNAGKAMVHRNIVTGIASLGSWSGDAGQEIPYTCEDRCAVLVQQDGSGPIIGATLVSATG